MLSVFESVGFADTPATRHEPHDSPSVPVPDFTSETVTRVSPCQIPTRQEIARLTRGNVAVAGVEKARQVGADNPTAVGLRQRA